MGKVNSLISILLNRRSLTLILTIEVTHYFGCVHGHRGIHPLGYSASARVRRPHPLHRADTEHTMIYHGLGPERGSRLKPYVQHV
jgi:hypothetical protein